MKKTILFVEPLFYGVNLLKEAKKMECIVVVIIKDIKNPINNNYEGLYDDYIIADTQDCLDILYKIRESKYDKNFDALIPASDYVTENAAIVAEQLGMRGASVVATKAARDKGLAQQIYVEKGVPCAKYAIVHDLDEAIREANRIGYPLVLKPQNACGSQNVCYISSERDLRNNFVVIENFKTSYLNYKIKDSYLLEEFLDGPEFSVEIYLENEKVLFSEVTEKEVSKLPYFVETMHVIPTSVLQDKENELKDVAEQAVKALGFKSGVLHVEVKYCSTGAKIIEVNGRPGGDNITSDLLINAKNVNLYKSLICWYLKEEVKFEKLTNFASAIIYILPPKKGVVTDVRNLNAINNNRQVNRCGLEVKLPCKVDVAKDSDGRLGYIIVTEKTPCLAKKTAKKMLDDIEILYEKN